MTPDEFELNYREAVDGLGNDLQTVAFEVASLSLQIAQLESKIARIGARMHQMNRAVEQFTASQRPQSNTPEAGWLP